MNRPEIQVGSTLTDGSIAVRITERMEKTPEWGTPGWRGVCIALEPLGGMTGYPEFIPDQWAGKWRHVPFEWTPCLGGRAEERYVWSPDYWRSLQHEVRPLVGDGLCDNREDHKPHSYTSESLGRLRCHADQTRRQPYASEQRRVA